MEGEKRLLRGTASPVRLKQRLTKEMAQLMTQYRDSGDSLKIGLGHCQLIIQAEEPDHQNQTTSIGIGSMNDVIVTWNQS